MTVISMENQMSAIESKIKTIPPMLFQILEREKGITFVIHRNYLICTSLEATSEEKSYYYAKSFELETGKGLVDSGQMYESPQEAIAEVKELLDAELDRRAVADHFQKFWETLKAAGFDQVQILDGLTLFAFEDPKLKPVQIKFEQAWQKLLSDRDLTEG